jgi:hypothetical protein
MSMFVVLSGGAECVFKVCPNMALLFHVVIETFPQEGDVFITKKNWSASENTD